jgi:hypothetical protein
MLQRHRLTAAHLSNRPPYPYRSLRNLTPERKQQDLAAYLKQRPGHQQGTVRKYSFEELFPRNDSVVSQLTSEAVEQANFLLRTQGKQASDEYLKNAPQKLLSDPPKKKRIQ